MGKKNNQIQKISQRVMLATLASSIVMAPVFSASASTSTNNKSAVAVETKNTTSAIATAVSTASISASALNSAVSILDSEGWLESANVEWSAVQDATGYNVYCKSADAADSEYQKIDSKLIRKYPSYFRADVLGLAEGNYVVKVVPVINGTENASKAATTKLMEVKSYVREGFAFSDQSPEKTSSGGYTNNGSVAANAKILYITKDNVNTVTLDVITKSNGAKTTCTGLSDILSKRSKALDKTPLIIRIVGQINGSDISALKDNHIEVKNCYNITFEGIGDDASVYKLGFLLRGAHNIEIRNLGFLLSIDDCLSVDTDNKNIWMHNNDFFYGSPGPDADQVKGDGTIDIKSMSDYITVSYNHFFDTGKSTVAGGVSDSQGQNFNITYHHNWFDHSDSRHARIKVGTIHMYNNYYDGVSKYGAAATFGASVFLETNYFRNCPRPMMISGQASDITDPKNPTLSGQPGAIIKAFNNKVEGATNFTYHTQNAVQFDAYLATSRNEVVPSTVKTVAGSNTYNNFDTNANMYKYSVTPIENLVADVTTKAGRINGGDLKWTFTNTDDKDHEINQALKNKITNYTSTLVSVGDN